MNVTIQSSDFANEVLNSYDMELLVGWYLIRI